MFTKENIIQVTSEDASSGVDYPEQVQKLRALGVYQYEHNLASGETEYLGEDRFSVSIGGQEPLSINGISSIDNLKQALKQHQRGETSFTTFRHQAATSGVYKWIADLEDMTVNYVDSMGISLVEEKIPKK